MKKLISTILVLATLLGCLAVLPIGSLALGNGAVTITVPVSQAETVTNEALGQNYASAQAKLEGDPNMQLYAELGNLQLYANVYTGEVYLRNSATGQVLNSNPYSLAAVKSETTRAKVMSQIVINYSETDSGSNEGVGVDMFSYKDASARGQIILTATKNGIRMDYTMGDTTKRYAMPYGIMAVDFIEKVMMPLQEDVAAKVYKFAEDNGVSESDLTRYYDYLAYCNRGLDDPDATEKSTVLTPEGGKTPVYSTLYKYGKEYTYGNIEAFDQWLTEAERAYTEHYNSMREQGGSESIAKPTSFALVIKDFDAINTVYGEISAYNNRRRQPTPATWTLNQNRLKVYPVLAEEEKTFVKENGDEITYYTNSFFRLDTELDPQKLRQYERIFKEYAPNFTMADILAAEERTGISAPAVENPVFYVSLIYTLTENGLELSMPATSIVYNESKYTVNSISVLPYFGTGDLGEGGYIFFPDGSGTVVDFDEFVNSSASVTGKVYGMDYAYYDTSSTTVSQHHQASVSLPVFGTVKDETQYFFKDPYTKTFIPCTRQQYLDKECVITYTRDSNYGYFYAVYPYGVSKNRVTQYYNDQNQGIKLSDDDTSEHYYATAKTVVKGENQFFATETASTGYLTILEDGASLATLKLFLEADAQNPFSSVYASYTPRAMNSYNLMDTMDAISTRAIFTVLADNKYLGDYKAQYVMLSDDALAAQAIADGKMTDYYTASYVGMAKAYQEYLVDAGVLTALTQLQDGKMPLFVESFGIMQATKRFLSIPYTVDAALTTFDDIELMHKELLGEGIENVKFRLTGFANGGMYSTYPAKLKWERKAGGKSGYRDLLTYVGTQNGSVEIFPDFNFAYVEAEARFDGIKLKNVGSRSVDNRYAFRRTYDPVYQTYVTMDAVVVNAENFETYFAKLHKKNKKYGNNSISLDYMASDLSTDFYEDSLTTREESLNYVQSFLKSVRNSGYTSVMSVGGNAYALAYVDYLLEAPVDSSHYLVTSNPIPFWGMVMHGFVQYAGNPFNEEANKSEALLRSIESGAALYFLLSYNTEVTKLMKDDPLLSDYYSVSYQISKDTVKKYYHLLNDTIGDLQGHVISNHQRIYAERVGVKEEVAQQIATLEREFLDQLAAAVLAEQETERALIKEAIDLREKFGTKTFEEIKTADPFTYEEIGVMIGSFATSNHLIAILGESGVAAPNAESSREALYDAIMNGEIISEYGKAIGVAFDEDAVIASAKQYLYTDTLNAEFEESIRAYMTATAAAGDTVCTIGELDYTSAYKYFTYSYALDEDYVLTESTVDNGSVVMVTYSNGEEDIRILLNFNIYSVTVTLEGEDTPITLGKYGYHRLDD